jgi:hypothetical protein
MSRPKSTLTPGFRKEVTRHKYHPSSKVFVKQNAIADEEDNAGYMSRMIRLICREAKGQVQPVGVGEVPTSLKKPSSIKIP